VRDLLGRGAKPGRAGADGITPLMAAAQAGHTETVRTLLDAGADVNARRGGGAKGRTALIDAAGAGHAEIVRLLLGKGADPNARGDGDATALIEAARGGHAAVAELLLERRADPNARTADGRMALHEAARAGTAASPSACSRAGAGQCRRRGGPHAPHARRRRRPRGDGHLAPRLGRRCEREAGSGATALSFAQRGGHAGVEELLRAVGARD
jgi:ankyrin repeat protein